MAWHGPVSAVICTSGMLLLLFRFPMRFVGLLLVHIDLQLWPCILKTRISNCEGFSKRKLGKISEPELCPQPLIGLICYR